MRGFDEKERERIEEELVEAARELLVRYGPAKTNVADVTGAVGIAKGTFYRFFDSKAELYLEIYRREVAEFTERTRAELPADGTTREGLETLFSSYAEWLEDNEFIQQALVRGDRREFHQDVPSETMEEVQREGLAEFESLFEPLREGGGLHDVDTVALLGLMSTIGLLVIHREEFEEYDPEYYGRIRDLLITSLARGLAAD